MCLSSQYSLFYKNLQYPHQDPAIISEDRHYDTFPFSMAVASDASRPHGSRLKRASLNPCADAARITKTTSRKNRIASNSMWTFESRLSSEHKAYKIIRTPRPKASHGSCIPVKSRYIIVHPTLESFGIGPGQDCRNSIAARRPHQELENLTAEYDLGKRLDDITNGLADTCIGAKRRLDSDAYTPHSGDDMEEICARLTRM